jgi:hypothetical protein
VHRLPLQPANGCGTTCTGPAQCKAGYDCTGTSCVALPAPALYWKLDEASGTLAADASGNNLQRNVHRHR